ncbi:MAG TPA: glycoside hydrolase family 32 protein [Verrucomicrobiae bacterium]|nr:glycoside hydrolase family 32 protein [Verrucomicrobiae bacterium]
MKTKPTTSLRPYIVLAVSFVATLGCVAADLPSYYTEPFRPQFHFTPEKNWMNDPNGLVYYEGEYHLFYQYNPFGDKWGHMSWGHAVSHDLIHWKHLPLALAEENGVMIFSGSAVVDWKNTSGFGKNGNPPIVATYAGNYTQKPLQNENIAYSNDRGRTWTKYSGNPVIDIGSKDFRDPKVFWHEPTKRWIMVVALSADHKIRFYASPNLKQWTSLSDFGPAGATSGVWECPDLFPLPVNFDTNQIKWVLIVGVGSGAPAGGTGVQYFIGNFDGTNFTQDDVSLSGSKPVGDADEVLADFEGDNYGNWKITGNAFGSGPVHPDASVTGYLGRKLVDSFGSSDSNQGTLTSPEFVVDRDYLSFLIGGGAHPGKVGMNLIVKGAIVKTATGNNSSSLRWQSWDVRQYRGKSAQLEIFDNDTNNDWGHIYVDQITLGNSPVSATADNALWADYGPDFYAAASWSDIPKSDGRRIWIGWMNNWQYGQDLPTSPWRSAMSVPRELSLIATGEGIRLAQQPVAELNQLREFFPLTFSGGSFADASRWLMNHTNLPPLLDVEMTFTKVSNESPFAVILQTGLNQQISIACEPALNQLIVDRRQSGLTAFNRDFSGRYRAPLNLTNGCYKLRLLVDTSSLETFVQDGKVVLTSLMFPNAGPRNLRLTLGKGGQPYVSGITIYKLKSAWNKDFPSTIAP